VEKVKKYFQRSIYFFFFENRAAHEKMWKKYGAARQAKDEIMAHAHCMLDN
jgi:hypothetical protein